MIRIGVFAIVSSLAFAADADEVTDDHRITASHETAVFALAGPMPITVTYENDSDERWTLYQPDRFSGVSMLAASDNPYYGRVSFSMGKTRVVETDVIVAYVAELPPQLTIEPEARYSFEADLNARFRSNLQEGNWTCSVKDRMEKLTSQPLPFSIVVTRDSVDRCLEVASDEEVYDYTRRWHGAYLAKVRPDLPFEFRGRNRTPEELAEVRAKNKETLEEFTTWWAEARDSQEVEEALERINEEAGVLEEYRKLREEQVAEEEEAAGNAGPDD